MQNKMEAALLTFREMLIIQLTSVTERSAGSMTFSDGVNKDQYRFLLQDIVHYLCFWLKSIAITFYFWLYVF